MEEFVMASIRTRTGVLFFDFSFLNERCREQTTLPDTPANRKRLEKVMKNIEAEITLNKFDYAKYFPNSSMIEKIRKKRDEQIRPYSESPTFKQFSAEWFDEQLPTWRRSTAMGYQAYLDNRLIPYFGDMEVSRITKGDILKFRSSTAKSSNGKLKPKTINKFMKFLKMILDESASRFNFTTPFQGIKTLKEEKVHLEPFSLDEVNLLLSNVRIDWQTYFIVRFFTGMRTGEVDGLKWANVDFERRQILVRETYSKGYYEYTKNDGSQREIDMSQFVYNTLFEHKQKQGDKFEHVFVSPRGEAINNANFLNRIWRPLLAYLKLKYRRPYQTRHTAATLWLAAGENPAWIAKQMGHVDTKMLFTVYTRYVPNLTRQDGSAMERLITNNISSLSTLRDKSSTTISVNKEPEVEFEDSATEANFWDQIILDNSDQSINGGAR
jgi:integrase